MTVQYFSIPTRPISYYHLLPDGTIVYAGEGYLGRVLLMRVDDPEFSGDRDDEQGFVRRIGHVCFQEAERVDKWHLW